MKITTKSINHVVKKMETTETMKKVGESGKMVTSIGKVQTLRMTTIMHGILKLGNMMTAGCRPKNLGKNLGKIKGRQPGSTMKDNGLAKRIWSLQRLHHRQPEAATKVDILRTTVSGVRIFFLEGIQSYTATAA